VSIDGTDGAGNARVELRTNGGAPYIDFARDNVSDFNARLVLTHTTTLTLQGAKLQATLSTGYVYRSCPPAASPADCSCAAGESIISGGTFVFAGNLIRESRPLQNPVTGAVTTWRVSCSNLAGTDVNCGDTSIVCAKFAP
jgi:hypothetical protein